MAVDGALKRLTLSMAEKGNLDAVLLTSGPSQVSENPTGIPDMGPSTARPFTAQDVLAALNTFSDEDLTRMIAMARGLLAYHGAVGPDDADWA